MNRTLSLRLRFDLETRDLSEMRVPDGIYRTDIKKFNPVMPRTDFHLPGDGILSNFDRFRKDEENKLLVSTEATRAIAASIAKHSDHHLDVDAAENFMARISASIQPGHSFAGFFAGAGAEAASRYAKYAREGSAYKLDAAGDGDNAPVKMQALPKISATKDEISITMPEGMTIGEILPFGSYFRLNSPNSLGLLLVFAAYIKNMLKGDPAGFTTTTYVHNERRTVRIKQGETEGTFKLETLVKAYGKTTDVSHHADIVGSIKTNVRHLLLTSDMFEKAPKPLSATLTELASQAKLLELELVAKENEVHDLTGIIGDLQSKLRHLPTEKEWRDTKGELEQLREQVKKLGDKLDEAMNRKLILDGEIGYLKTKLGEAEKERSALKQQLQDAPSAEDLKKAVSEAEGAQRQIAELNTIVGNLKTDIKAASIKTSELQKKLGEAEAAMEIGAELVDKLIKGPITTIEQSLLALANVFGSESPLFKAVEAAKDLAEKAYNVLKGAEEPGSPIAATTETKTEPETKPEPSPEKPAPVQTPILTVAEPVQAYDTNVEKLLEEMIGLTSPHLRDFTQKLSSSSIRSLYRLFRSHDPSVATGIINKLYRINTNSLITADLFLEALEILSDYHKNAGSSGIEGLIGNVINSLSVEEYFGFIHEAIRLASMVKEGRKLNALGKKIPVTVNGTNREIDADGWAVNGEKTVIEIKYIGISEGNKEKMFAQAEKMASAIQQGIIDRVELHLTAPRGLDAETIYTVQQMIPNVTIFYYRTIVDTPQDAVVITTDENPSYKWVTAEPGSGGRYELVGKNAVRLPAADSIADNAQKVESVEIPMPADLSAEDIKILDFYFGVNFSIDKTTLKTYQMKNLGPTLSEVEKKLKMKAADVEKLMKRSGIREFRQWLKAVESAAAIPQISEDATGTAAAVENFVREILQADKALDKLRDLAAMTNRAQYNFNKIIKEGINLNSVSPALLSLKDSAAISIKNAAKSESPLEHIDAIAKQMEQLGDRLLDELKTHTQQGNNSADAKKYIVKMSFLEFLTKFKPEEIKVSEYMTLLDPMASLLKEVPDEIEELDGFKDFLEEVSKHLKQRIAGLQAELESISKNNAQNKIGNWLSEFESLEKALELINLAIAQITNLAAAMEQAEKLVEKDGTAAIFEKLNGLEITGPDSLKRESDLCGQIEGILGELENAVINILQNPYVRAYNRIKAVKQTDVQSRLKKMSVDPDILQDAAGEIIIKFVKGLDVKRAEEFAAAYEPDSEMDIAWKEDLSGDLEVWWANNLSFIGKLIADLTEFAKQNEWKRQVTDAEALRELNDTLQTATGDMKLYKEWEPTRNPREIRNFHITSMLMLMSKRLKLYAVKYEPASKLNGDISAFLTKVAAKLRNSPFNMKTHSETLKSLVKRYIWVLNKMGAKVTINAEQPQKTLFAGLNRTFARGIFSFGAA